MSSGTEAEIAAASTLGAARRRPSSVVAKSFAAAASAGSAGRIVRREQDTLAPKARIRVARLEKAADEGAGGHEHDERQRDLQTHQRVAKSASSGQRRAGAHGQLRIDPRELHGRNEPERETAQNPEEHRERETPGIDRRLEVHGEANSERHRRQRVRRPHGDRHSERRSSQRKDHALGEEEADDPPRTRSSTSRIPISR